MIRFDVTGTHELGWVFRSAVAAGLLHAVFSTPPAFAQTPGSGLASSYSANSDKPIDIQADSLEVDDKKKIATFRGNVSATQGDFNIRAKELLVTYTSKDSAKNTEASDAPSPPGAANADITQIDAKGRVLIKTKDNQEATSDWAIFEVKKQLVTIGGDVVLSQGENVIKGNHLVIDLRTGLSRFETVKNNDTNGEKTGRGVQMKFTPKSRPKAKN